MPRWHLDLLKLAAMGLMRASGSLYSSGAETAQNASLAQENCWSWCLEVALYRVGVVVLAVAVVAVAVV